MRTITLAILLLSLSTASFSQTNLQPLTFKNGFFGWQFKQGDEKLRPGQVADILQVNPEAAALFSKGRSNYTLANVISTVGGFMFGYTVGSSISGGKANWTVGGIGAGLAVVAVPISISATSKVRKAIAIYNEGPKTGSLRKQEWQLQFTGNQMGLVYRF